MRFEGIWSENEGRTLWRRSLAVIGELKMTGFEEFIQSCKNCIGEERGAEFFKNVPLELLAL